GQTILLTCMASGTRPDPPGLVAGPGVDVAAAELRNGAVHRGAPGVSGSALVRLAVVGDGAAAGESGQRLAISVAARIHRGGLCRSRCRVVPSAAPGAVAGVGNR